MFDGQGCEHEAILTEISRSRITLKIREPVATTPEAPLRLTLLQGIARNDRMDFILQKAVELGIQAIQPIWMQRSHTRLKGIRLEKRIGHWQGVITSACEQSGRSTLPQLLLPEDYSTCISSRTDSNLRLMLQPDARSCLRNMEKPPGGISILVGPEGGLTPEEQTLARTAGFSGIRMGPRILRTETAALAAVASIQTLWGDFS